MKLDDCDNLISEGLEYASKTPKEKMDDCVSEIGVIMERIYKLRPYLKPNAGFETREIGDRPFNYDICDDECDKEREREEFEAHL